MADGAASTAAAPPTMIGTLVEDRWGRASAVSRCIAISRPLENGIAGAGAVPAFWAAVKRGVAQESSG